MVEYVMKIAEESVTTNLEILLQHYNCSPSSSHGATNSVKEIPTLEPLLNVNLPIQDEICSSAKQIRVPAEPISESSSSLEPYFDNLVTDSTKIVDYLGESALDNAQRIGEFRRGDGFEVQCDSQLTDTTGDCYSGVIATPELSNAEPITTH
jgi:Sec7-like guanine-nucleotide exchange factor